MTENHICGDLFKLQIPTFETGVQHKGASFFVSVSYPSLKHSRKGKVRERREPGTLSLRKVSTGYGDGGAVGRAWVSQGYLYKIKWWNSLDNYWLWMMGIWAFIVLFSLVYVWHFLKLKNRCDFRDDVCDNQPPKWSPKIFSSWYS